MYSLFNRNLLTGMLDVIVSKTPGVFVTALINVPYFPSAAARSRMDCEEAGTKAVERNASVASLFIVPASSKMLQYPSCWMMNFEG